MVYNYSNEITDLFEECHRFFWQIILNVIIINIIAAITNVKYLYNDF